MKSRYDFVTNSSSTSYIVCIPKNFDVHKEKENLDEEDFDELVRVFDTLDLTKEVDEFDFQLDNAIQICKSNGFVLHSFPTGPDEGAIINFGIEQLEKMKVLLETK